MKRGDESGRREGKGIPRKAKVSRIETDHTSVNILL